MDALLVLERSKDRDGHSHLVLPSARTHLPDVIDIDICVLRADVG